MGQNVPTQQQATFNYAGLETMSEFLPCLKLDEGKQTLVSFLENIPGMQNPPFVYAKVHWNSEMGDNGRMYQCFGGSCCQQVTWQKGWGDEPGKFDVNKARTRFYIPLVHYEPDPQNPAVMRATIKYLDMTYSAYNALVNTVNNNTEGLSFFDRDITLEATKVNGATIYLFHKKESQAMWKTNDVFRQQVEEQLPTVAQKLAAAMPKVFTEDEFMALKPQLDAKLKAAMASHGQINSAPQSQYGALPANQVQGVPQVPVPPQVPAPPQAPIPSQAPTYTQPVVNVPIAPTPAAALSQSAAETTQPAVPQVPQQVTVAAPEAPSVSLDFDPNALLK